MVDWVKELRAKGMLMDAVDPNLCDEFLVEDEMERVLKLGLLCCNPNAERRLGMRQVLLILEGEASLPAFDAASYWHTSPSSHIFKSTPYIGCISDIASTSMSLEGCKFHKQPNMNFHSTLYEQSKNSPKDVSNFYFYFFPKSIFVI